MPDPSMGAAPEAVVVGLDCITGLQTARILAAHGVSVVGLAGDRHHPFCRTRACRAVHPSGAGDADLLSALEGIALREGRRAVLYPCTDAAVLALARGRERLERSYHVVLPETEVVERLLDKARFHAHAESAGLPLPETRVLRGLSDAYAAAGELPFPCLLKPSVRTARWEEEVGRKVLLLPDADALLANVERCLHAAGRLVAQEWIQGGDAELYSCNCYFDRRGHPVVTFVARKLRQWPPRAGTSCLGEECRNDTVREIALRTFSHIGFRGLGYVEVKRDPRTDRHYLLEANVGRPTGRSAIAEAGGVALLYAMYCDTAGLPLPDGLEQRYRGAKWIYWRQDVRSALYYLRRGELSLGEWAESWRGRKASAVFAWTDPWPFLGDVPRLARRAVTAGSRRRAR